MNLKLVSVLVLISSSNVLAAESPTGADRIPLFGETHMHTAFSLDAFMFGTRATIQERAFTSPIWYEPTCRG